jgi:hypothetical protein
VESSEFSIERRRDLQRINPELVKKSKALWRLGLSDSFPNLSLTFSGRILFGSFFRVAELLGDYGVVRIKFVGILEGIDCLRPLVAYFIEAAQSQP